MKIQTVTSPGGIEAWLVEEHSLPLLTMNFAFLGGAAGEPADKTGLANFMTAMMDEGAGGLRAADFQERVEELAMRMSFDAGRDEYTGAFQTLTKNREASTDLLRLALTQTRFDPDAVERMRKQILANIAFDAKDPDRIADDVWYSIAFKGHPYSRPVTGTVETVTAITPEDLHEFRQRLFAKDNLRVAVVGDITAEELGRLLDKVFGDLPAKSGIDPIAPAELPITPITKLVEMDVPQSVAVFGHAGLSRKDPDFIPGFIADYILGGGGLTSRLMDEVREKRGLAYSVYSYMQSYDGAAIHFGRVATKTEAIGKSLEVIRGELQRMADEGPTPEELDDAKRYLTGSYALRFDSSSKIAGQLLGIQIEELGIDYVDKRNSLIEAVTIEDVRRVAKRFLDPGNLIVTVVGRKSGIVQN